LSDIENEMKWSNQKTIMFQVGIIKACMSDSVVAIPQIEPKIEAKKQDPKNLKHEEVKKPEAKPVMSAENTEKSTESKKDSKQIEKVDNNSGNSEINWVNVINSLRASGKVRLYTSLANTKINQQGDLILEIVFPNGLTPFVKGILEESSNKKDLSEILFKETGKEWHIKLVDGKNGGISPKPETKTNSKSVNDLGIDINVIE